VQALQLNEIDGGYEKANAEVPSMENLADILELKFRQISKKINKFNFPSVFF